MGNYVVYVNHPNNKAFIHSTTCGYYIHRKSIDVKTGYWSTVFKTRKDAEAFGLLLLLNT
ncbi:hypothetical protein E2P63_05235 [Candidatus Bathyarchaeota archaeon]|nr:hypothetical protein E2P63_05235 [Candidatus Bathyarchaeota archaeon]